MFRIPIALSHKLRHFSTFSTHVLEELTNRTLIKVSGLEANTFLQGLITNDINHLEHGMGCIYSMFLNTKGRVLYDSLIYKTEDANSFLIECDVDAAPTLQKHLKLYKVKRKIDITSLQNDYKIYALYNPSKALSSVDKQKTSLDGIIVPCNAITNTETEAVSETRVIDDLFFYNDPRTSLLGTRIITPDKNCIREKVSKATNINIGTNSNQTYRWYRYNLGIGEGVTDLPPNNCFPLEANCDYLHGVSFHKGCYIGQELTARTHHTGVVRKRLMPLFLKDVLKTIPENDSIIHDEVNLGKLRGVENNVGLGLLRIAKAIKFDEIKLGTTAATTGKPTWWPIEAPKEKMSA